MKNKRWRAALFLILAVCVAYALGGVRASLTYAGINYAETALKKTGISVQYAPSYCLHGDATARDSFAQTVFTVEHQSDRQALLEEAKRTKGWRAAPVTATEYLAFQRACLWKCGEVLSVPADTVFDAWYYCETSAPVSNAVAAPAGALEEIGPVGRGFEFAVFDAETGLFVFVDQFG